MSYVWKIYMLAIVSFLVGTSEFIIAGILDKIAEDAGVSVAAAGQLITVFSLAYAFGTPILMAATAKMERKKLLIYALAVFAAGNFIAVLIPGFGFLMASRVVLALSTGVFVVTALTVAAKLAPAEKQGSAIATLVMGFSTSLIIGVPIGRVAAAAYDWKLIFAGIGLLGLLSIVLILFAIPHTKGEEPVPIRVQLALLKQPKIVVALLVTFFWIGGYSIANTYLSPYLLNVSGLSEHGVSAGLFAFGIASLVGSKLGGYGTDKWGAPRTLVIGMLIHAAALMIISITGQSSVLIFPLLMLWSFSAWSSGPTQQYNLISLAPEASGIMLSLNTSMLQLAMAAGAGLGGVVVEQLSLSSITWIGAAGVTVAAATAVLSFRLSGTAVRKKAAEDKLLDLGA